MEPPPGTSEPPPSALPESQVKTILQQLSNVLDKHIDSKLKAHSYVGLQLPNKTALGSVSPLKGIYRPSSEEPEAAGSQASGSNGGSGSNVQDSIKSVGGGVTQVQLKLKGDTAVRSRCKLVSTSGQADFITGAISTVNAPAKVVVFDPDLSGSGHLLDGAAVPAKILPDAPEQRVMARVVSLKACMMTAAPAPADQAPPTAEPSEEFHLDLVGVSSRPGDPMSASTGPSVKAVRTLPDLSRLQRKYNKTPLQRFASSSSIPDVDVPPSSSSNAEAARLSRGIDGLISMKSGRSSYSGAASSSAGGTPTSSTYGGVGKPGMPAYRASCSGVLCADVPASRTAGGDGPRSRLATAMDWPYRASTGGSAIDGWDNIKRHPSSSPLQPTKHNRQSSPGVGDVLAQGSDGTAHTAIQASKGTEGVLWRGQRTAPTAIATGSETPSINSLMDCLASGKHALVVSYEKSAQGEVQMPLDPKNLAFSAAGATSVTGTYVYGKRERFKSLGGNSMH